MIAKILPDFLKPKLTMLKYTLGLDNKIVTLSKKNVIKVFKVWYNDLSDTYIMIFLDGFKLKNEIIGYSYVIYKNRKKII